MLRPLQQHPQFAACLRAGGRNVIETEHGNMLLRRFAGLPVGLISRGSRAMLSAPAPRLCTRIFNAEAGFDGPLSQSGFRRLHAPQEVAEWDLTASRAELHNGLRKTWRHALGKARDNKMKLTVTTMSASPDHWLLKAEYTQSRARRYRALPLWITQAWVQLFPKDALLIEARHRGETVAGMVFLRHGDVASYHISHATQAGRRLDAHRALLWHGVKHVKTLGVTRLDLGTIDRDAALGLARFKLGTGARARALGGTWIALPGAGVLRRQFMRHSPSGQKA